MSDVSIRFIKENEIDRLVDLSELHAEFERAEYTREGKEENLRRHLFQENSPLFCLVAIGNNKIVGYATYMQQYSTWDASYYYYMDCLYLESASRSKGIGQQLMERIEAEGQKNGIKMIQWQTPEFNTRAIKFYNRFGGVSKSKERYFYNVK